MTCVSLAGFRKDAGGILAKIRRGQTMLLTVRGKPVARLEPCIAPPATDDSLYHLADLAVDNTAPLSNREIDGLIYEK